MYKKQIKNKIQNKQTEKPKHCPAAIMSSCKTPSLSTMSRMSSTFQRKRCKKNLRAALLKIDIKKTHRYNTPALKEALNPLFTVVELLSLRN